MLLTLCIDYLFMKMHILYADSIHSSYTAVHIQPFDKIVILTLHVSKDLCKYSGSLCKFKHHSYLNYITIKYEDNEILILECRSNETD
jgi:hypothetical protein